MKTFKQLFKVLLSVIFGLLLLSSCEKSEGSSPSIGGDSNLDQNQVGNTETRTIKLGGSPRINSTLKVVDNSNGIITADISFPVPSSFTDAFNNIGNGLYGADFSEKKSTSVDSNGNFNLRIKYKNTSEGVALVNSMGKQAVIMKYDTKVGDKWSYKKKSGKTVNYKVVKKSETDDYDFGFFNIKVVQVERTSNEPGVNKVVYTGNHKFGLVNVEFYLDDGSTIEIS